MGEKNGKAKVGAEPDKATTDVVETRHVLALSDREKEGFGKELGKRQAVAAKINEYERIQQLVPQWQAELIDLQGQIKGRARVALEARGIDSDESVSNWAITITDDRVSITYMAPHGSAVPEAEEAKEVKS